MCVSNHFISSSFIEIFCDTCNSGHYARPGASLSVIVAVLVSIIKQHFLINEFTAGISEYMYMYRAVFLHPLIVF